MPTYEYICPQCGVFEEFHGINTSLTYCPVCNRAVRRLISRNNNVIFKGSGFHNTDYRSKDYAKKAATESSASGSGASSVPAAPDKSQNGEVKSSSTQNKAS